MFQKLFFDPSPFFVLGAMAHNAASPRGASNNIVFAHGYRAMGRCLNLVGKTLLQQGGSGWVLRHT